MPTEIMKPRYACATDGTSTYIIDLNQGEGKEFPVRVWRPREGGDPGQIHLTSHKVCCREHASMNCNGAMRAMSGKKPKQQAEAGLGNILGEILQRLSSGQGMPDGVQVRVMEVGPDGVMQEKPASQPTRQKSSNGTLH